MLWQSRVTFSTRKKPYARNDSVSLIFINVTESVYGIFYDVTMEQCSATSQFVWIPRLICRVEQLAHAQASWKTMRMIACTRRKLNIVATYIKHDYHKRGIAAVLFVSPFLYALHSSEWATPRTSRRSIRAGASRVRAQSRQRRKIKRKARRQVRTHHFTREHAGGTLAAILRTMKGQANHRHG